MRILRLIVLTVALTAGMALADSSGNFSATGTSASCSIGSGGTLSGGTTLTSFSADISTSNGNGVVLDIRPNLVTGLFTDTKIDTSIPSASAETGIEVCVTVDGSGTGVMPTSCVIYDERFQQISSQLFSQLSECTTTTTCSPTTPCASGFTCSSTTGSGVCLNNLCNFELILSTLSAHSFDFVVNMPGQGSHTIQVSWSVIGSGATSGSVASCVGPGDVLVTQYKVFNNSGALSFSSL